MVTIVMLSIFNINHQSCGRGRPQAAGKPPIGPCLSSRAPSPGNHDNNNGDDGDGDGDGDGDLPQSTGQFGYIGVS